MDALADLIAGPAQVWGAVRLVPLMRDEPVTGLRLHARLHPDEQISVVSTGPRRAYVSYVPHSFVASWGEDGLPAAAFGTQLVDPEASPRGIPLTFRRRPARREDRRRLRFLPLHLAVEGFLALEFAGPPIAWEEWTHRAVTQGLSPRAEAAYNGGAIDGLDDALRIFEIHPDQCGMVLYVADALAAAFVVPHPDDYRALHRTLLSDFYGELIYQYALMYPAVADFTARLDDARITDLAGLRREIGRSRAEWTSFHTLMAGGLREHRATPVYTMGRFTLSRSLPSFDPDVENHLGETITDDEGRLAYLKTFRLSAAQTRRGHLLSTLAAYDWRLDETAAALGTDRQGLVMRLDRAGFGHLLRPEIIDACRAAARRR
ncbi:ARPP-2 domain-containing protein [Catenuloplanes japonicus]|uniref:ARPP-2 domain-containing protein n=1 Tax=Catenuloplanes japonicus TaxID=33876 RepID=UPI000A82C870|nr:hypothetical protein [Catenuloplanes japonicus]